MSQGVPAPGTHSKRGRGRRHIPKATCGFSSWPCSICSRKTLRYKIFRHRFREKEGSEPSPALLAESRTGSDRLAGGGSLLSLLFSQGPQMKSEPSNTKGRAYRLDKVSLNILKAGNFLKFCIFIFPSFPLNTIFCFKGQHKFHTVTEDIFIQIIKRTRLD